MAKMTKDSKKKNVEAKPPHKHMPLMLVAGVAILGLVLIGYFAFKGENASDEVYNEDSTNSYVEPTPFAEQLEAVELDPNATDKEKGEHYASIAYNYMSIDNIDKAQEYYLLADNIGFESTRVLSDLATIFGQKGETEKLNTYLDKLKALIEKNPDKLDQGSVDYQINNSFAAIYEVIGDKENTKIYYQKVIDILGTIDNGQEEDNQIRIDYLKDKISNL
jgi:tetratricopeptide (TPR) repeat protein